MACCHSFISVLCIRIDFSADPDTDTAFLSQCGSGSREPNHFGSGSWSDFIFTISWIPYLKVCNWLRNITTEVQRPFWKAGNPVWSISNPDPYSQHVSGSTTLLYLFYMNRYPNGFRSVEGSSGVPNQDSNSGLPYCKPTHYYLSYRTVILDLIWGLVSTTCFWVLAEK